MTITTISMKMMMMMMMMMMMLMMMIISVDVRGLPRESTRSAMTTRWPCEYTGRCVESTGSNGTTISLWQSQRIETFASPGT